MKINLRKTKNDELAKMIYDKNGATGPNWIMLNDTIKLCVCGHGNGHYSIWLMQDRQTVASGRQQVIKYLKENNLEIIL